MTAWLALTGQVVILLTVLIGLRRSLSKIQELHISMNSRLTELIDAVRRQADSEGHARGLAEGRESRKD